MTPSARPMYFSSSGESLFGWLHVSRTAPQTRLGIVLCKPFGYESMCADNSVRALADVCAAAGATALRFDYRGTGDSSGGESDDDQLQSWCADIEAAVQALRAHADVTQVGLVGLRLGALLAGLVAARNPEIDLLIAVAPIVSGRRYIRELRAFHASASSQALTSPGSIISPEAANTGAGLDVTGYRLAQSSVDHLATVDLSTLRGHAVTDAVILDRLDVPSAAAWATALRESGTRVEYRALPGIPEMITAPHVAEVPRDIVAAVGEFLSRHLGPQERETDGASTAAPPASMEFVTGAGRRLFEQARFLGDKAVLFSVVTDSIHRGSPASPGGRAGVLLLNCGANSHVGPNRLYVDLARSWAALGYCVLRLDLQGLGDSAPLPAEENSAAYPPTAIDDIGTAVEIMRREYGVDHLTLAGLCSGAYHALRAATAGLAVDTVLLVNPLTFYWKHGSKLSDIQDAEVVRNPGVYAAHALSLQHWRRLLLARVNVRRVASIVIRRLLFSLTSSLRGLGRLLRIHLPSDLGWELRALMARDVRVVFIFARSDSGRDLLRLQAGSVIRSTDERCRVLVIDGADHTFTQRNPRLELQRLLTAELPHLPNRDAPDAHPGNACGAQPTPGPRLRQTPAR